MSTKYYNPYIEDERLIELTPADIADEQARDVAETVEEFIDGLRDWDILADLDEHGVPYATYDDNEFAQAVLEQVIMSLEADLLALIGDIVDSENE